ncbi:TonB-dependent receptor [Pseudomonas sp. sia0905]|uniref:TonB-dependent receptor domain-containing protein n=1 Tax=Pseudomonas sp. sia0905 TaxID=2854783 RepID=UPI001C44B7CC|nr:TonB-dependent receptor [Pseudomonas sp. sia0905]MBV7564341.1 TonB-dependent receptor [Pseudomonas sp. sia0905]
MGTMRNSRCKKTTAGTRHMLACSLLLAIAGLPAQPLMAADAKEAASEQQRLRFDIPPQPLDEALASYGITSGVQVLYGASLTSGLQSAAVQGEMTRQQALAQLLSGTGLNYRFTAERSATLSADAATGSLELSPLTVSGEKIGRTLEQTMTSVAVNTDADLRAHADEDLGDVFARTPGVYSQAGNENWGIRGVPVSGFDDQGPATLNGAVSVFVDGAQQPNRSLTLGPVPLWDVEQVEVLMGPQSTTQGRNSLAGAVVVQTRNPTFEPDLRAQTRVGNYGEKGAAVAVGGALVDQVVAGRLAVDYQEGDGYIDNITVGGDANPRRASTVRGKLLVLPNDDLDVLLSYSRGENRQGENSSLRQDGRVRYYKVASNTRAYDDLEQDTGSAKVDYRLDDFWTLTSQTTLTRADYRALLDFDQSAAENQEVRRRQDTRMFSEELRLGYEGEGVRGFVGAYYGRTTNDFHDRLLDSGALLRTLRGDTQIDNQALFGELNWTFAPQWTLITGLRYDRERNQTDVQQDDFSRPAKASKTFTALLPKLGLDYQFADNQYLGFTVQKGYRGGGVNTRAGSGHGAYDPEYTTNYELSYRGAWREESVRLRANLFYTDWKDQQVSIRESNAVFSRIYNASSSTIKGLEVFLEQDLTSQLSINAGLAYTDGRYGDFVTGTGQDMSGESFLYAPRYKASTGARYRFANGLMVGGDLVYQEGTPSQYEFGADGKVTRTHMSDHYVLMNLNAEYALTEQLVLSGYVKNLFDKHYITNNRNDEIIDVGAPRSFGLVLDYKL